MKKQSVGFVVSLFVAAIFTVAGIFFLSSAVKVAGQKSSKGWRVWVRTEPCVGRFDWLYVGKEAPPPQGGGLAHYLPYELVVGRSPSPSIKDCLDSTENGCTFAEATTLREALRGNKKFFDFCCRDYSVWKDKNTGKKYVALVRTGTMGEGQEFVKGPLCCEVAEELAGTPGACSGSKGGALGWGTYQNGSINQGHGKVLTSYRGTTPEQCQADCTKNAQCVAFTLIKAGAFSPNDPAVCYLMSEAKIVTPSPCCITAIKGEGGSDKEGDARISRTNRNQDNPRANDRNQDPPQNNDRSKSGNDGKTASPAGSCTLAGTWSHSTSGGVGSSSWTITNAGRATETGLGGAVGTASLAGKTLRIDWKTSNGYSGFYEWNLDSNCSSGSGKLVFLSGSSGTRTSSVSRR